MDWVKDLFFWGFILLLAYILFAYYKGSTAVIATSGKTATNIITAFQGPGPKAY